MESQGRWRISLLQHQLLVRRGGGRLAWWGRSLFGMEDSYLEDNPKHRFPEQTESCSCLASPAWCLHGNINLRWPTEVKYLSGG